MEPRWSGHPLPLTWFPNFKMIEAGPSDLLVYDSCDFLQSSKNDDEDDGGYCCFRNISLLPDARLPPFHAGRKGLLPSSCGQQSQSLERGDGRPELTEPPPLEPEPTGQLQASPHATHGLILLGTPGPSLPASQGSGETGDQDAPVPKYQT